jgi:peptidoglycan/LPS O-acetylase OafA/YrhL
MQRESALEYNPALDGIRAFAVLAVIARHCEVPGLTGGFLGVDVFFVLSGFLITSLLREEMVRTGRIDFRLFYIRRFLRLGPPLLLMLAVYLTWAPFVWPDYSLIAHVRDVVLAGIYLSDISRAFWGVPVYLSHTWSLSIEEHFYLLWPLLAAALFASSKHRQVLVLAILFVIATQWRIVTLPLVDNWMEVYYRFDARISGLILGALAAVMISEGLRVNRWAADIIAGVSVLALAFCVFTLDLKMTALYVWGFTVVEIASFGLLIAATTPDSVFYRIAAWKPLVGIGLVSYGLYLWHGPIARALWLPGEFNWQMRLALTLIISVPLAVASYRWLEVPMRRLRYRLKGRQAIKGEGVPANA